MPGPSTQLTIGLTAQDQASGPIKDVAQSMAQLASSAASSDAKLATSHNTLRKSADEAHDSMLRFKKGLEAISAAGLAMKAFNDLWKASISQIKKSVPDLAELTHEATRTDKILASIKKTVTDPEFEKIGLLARIAAVGYSALNTKLVEVEASSAKINAQAKERALNAKASMAMVEEEGRIKSQVSREDEIALKKKFDAIAEEGKRDRERIVEWKRQQNEYKAELKSRVADEIQALKASTAAYLERQKAEQDARKETAKEWMRGVKVASADYIKSAEDDTKRVEQLEAEKTRVYTNAAGAMAQTWGNAFGQLATGSQDASKIMIGAVVDTAERAIMAYSATAAAGAASSQAGIPVVGPILAGVAATVMFALVRAYLAKMDIGGLVPGGHGAAVPIIAHGGERVLTERQTEAFERLVSRLDKGGGSGAAVVINNKSIFSPTSAETKRQVREVGRIQRKLAKKVA